MTSWPPQVLTPVSAEALERSRGKFAVNFAETFGSIGKDGIAGKRGAPLKFRDWQKHLFDCVYARDENKDLQFRTVLIGLPRKNGKSASVTAAVALYKLYAEGVRGAEIIIAAAETNQARIIFDECKRMVLDKKDLADMSQVFANSIFVAETGNVLKVVSAEAYSKEGYNPSCVILDELHAHKDRSLFDVFSLAMGNRGKIGQLIAITTAGVKNDMTGQDSIAYSLYNYGKRIAAGEIKDDTFFMAWWEAPETADHTDPETWKLANPGYDDLVAAEDFASAVRRTPEAEFRTKRLNQWVNSQTAWLPNGAWLDCEQAEWDSDAEYVLGFDGSFSGDSTALVACTIPQGDELPKIYLVAAWEKDFAIDDDSWRVPIAEVEQTIREFIQANPYCREIACDPFRWQRSMEALMNEGLPIVEYNTGSLARMIPATAKFYDAVVEKRLMHDGNPVLARHLDNCVLKVDARGPRVTKAKDGSKRKIDAAISALIAFDRATVGRIEQGAPEFFYL